MGWKRCVGLAVSLFLLFAFLLFLLYGEGEKDEERQEAQETQETSDTLVVGISFNGADAEDVALVEEKINEITREKLGVGVRLISDSDEIELTLGSDARLDIMMMNNDSLWEAYMDGKLTMLDDLLLEYGGDIRSEVGDSVINACAINGILYGIPNNRDFASGYEAYMMRRDILDKYGISPENIRDEDDLEAVLALVKEKEPEMTPLSSGYGTMMTHLYFATGHFTAGILMDYGREEDTSFPYETEEYMQALKRIRRWYLKGYLDTDFADATDTLFARVKEGSLFAYTTKWKPDIEIQDNASTGQDMVCVQLGETALLGSSIEELCYVIPVNTADAAQAMRLLNLFYSDADIMNLLCYGVEGVHYKKLADGHITYADSGRDNPFVSYGWNKPNQYITYVWEGNDLDLWEQMRRFNETAYKASDIGFRFDFRSVAKDYYALCDIYSRYRKILENGLVNPEEGLRQMLAEMEENGLSDVKKQYETQYENWKKKKTAESF